MPLLRKLRPPVLDKEAKTAIISLAEEIFEAGGVLEFVPPNSEKNFITIKGIEAKVKQITDDYNKKHQPTSFFSSLWKPKLRERDVYKKVLDNYTACVVAKVKAEKSPEEPTLEHEFSLINCHIRQAIFHDQGIQWLAKKNKQNPKSLNPNSLLNKYLYVSPATTEAKLRRERDIIEFETDRNNRGVMSNGGIGDGI